MAVSAGFRRLVQLLGRAFYAGECPPPDTPEPGMPPPPKGKQRQDFRGLGVIVLDALTRREWVAEEQLAEDIKINPKQLRKVLRFFEEEQLLARVHLKAPRKKKGKADGDDGGDAAAGTETAEGPAVSRNGMQLTVSYCCLDYPRIMDVVRLRLHRARSALQEQVKDRAPIQQYTCPSCGQRFSSLQAMELVDFATGEFRCETCKTPLAQLLSSSGEAGDEAARRARREALKNLLARFEAQLRPLTDQLARLQNMAAPDFGTLQQWAAARHHAEQGGADGRGGGAYGAGANGNAIYGIDAPAPGAEGGFRVVLGDSASGAGEAGASGTGAPKQNGARARGAAAGAAAAAPKVLPPWLRSQLKVAGENGESSTAAVPSTTSGEESVGGTGIAGGGVEADVPPEDIQQAYVRQFMEQVARQRELLAAQAGVAGDDKKKADLLIAKAEGGAAPAGETPEQAAKRVKREDGAWAAAQGIKAEPGAEAGVKPEPGAAAVVPGAGAAAAAAAGAAPEAEEEDGFEWEDASVAPKQEPQVPTPKEEAQDEEEEVEWEDMD